MFSITGANLHTWHFGVNELLTFLRVDGVTRFSATTHYLLCLSSYHFGMYGIVQLGYGYRPAVYI